MADPKYMNFTPDKKDINKEMKLKALEAMRKKLEKDRIGKSLEASLTDQDMKDAGFGGK